MIVTLWVKLRLNMVTKGDLEGCVHLLILLFFFFFFKYSPQDVLETNIELPVSSNFYFGPKWIH